MHFINYFSSSNSYSGEGKKKYEVNTGQNIKLLWKLSSCPICRRFGHLAESMCTQTVLLVVLKIGFVSPTRDFGFQCKESKILQHSKFLKMWLSAAQLPEFQPQDCSHMPRQTMNSLHSSYFNCGVIDRQYYISFRYMT